ncbi:MAG: hypothetical protein RLZZ524_3120 [Pseudomonadota bacterium]|jgi:hypothetical protein
MLTTEQLATLRADVVGNADTLTLYNAGDRAGLADAYNANASPAFTVWKTQVTRAEAQASGFDWTQVDNLTTGQARIWFDGLFLDGMIDPSDVGQRAGISEAWKGTAAKTAVATFVLGVCKRAASRFERVFAQGVGSAANPGTLTLIGPVTPELFIDV